MNRLQFFLQFCERKLTGEQLAEFYRAWDYTPDGEAELSATTSRIYSSIIQDAALHGATHARLQQKLDAQAQVVGYAEQALETLTSGYDLKRGIQGLASSVKAFGERYAEAIARLEAAKALAREEP